MTEPRLYPPIPARSRVFCRPSTAVQQRFRTKDLFAPGNVNNRRSPAAKRRDAAPPLVEGPGGEAPVPSLPACSRSSAPRCPTQPRSWAVESAFAVPPVDQATGAVLDRDLLGTLDLVERDADRRLVVV